MNKDPKSGIDARLDTSIDVDAAVVITLLLSSTKALAAYHLDAESTEERPA